jgi:tetratricopeptide (TPR) repeat protein
MYLPLVAVIAAVTLGVYSASAPLMRRLVIAPMACTVFGIWFALSTCAALGILAAMRNADYRSAISIWEDTLANLPLNPRAHINLGNVLAQQGKLSEAADQFRAVIRTNADAAGDEVGIASAEAGNGAHPAACRQGGAKNDACKALAHTNLGNVLARQGKLSEAIAHFQAAIRIKPDYAEAYYNLGVALASRGDATGAIALFKAAIRLRPGFAEAYYGLGKALASNGLAREAIVNLRRAIETRADFAEARSYLGDLLRQEGNTAEAVIQLREAIRIKPQSPAAINVLAWILATNAEASIRNGTEAVELARRAVALSDYRDPAALDTLAAAYAGAGRFPEAAATAERARELALRDAKTALAERIGGRLELYRSRTQFRDAAKK